MLLTSLYFYKSVGRKKETEGKTLGYELYFEDKDISNIVKYGEQNE
jgi:hypothetical protein